MSRLERLRFIDIRRTQGPVRRKVRSRGVPPALAAHEIFYSESVRETAALLGAALAPGHLVVDAAPPAVFAASLHGVRLRDVSLLHLDLSVTGTLDIPVLGNYYTVCLPTNGQVTYQHAGQKLEANTVCALVTSPGLPLTLHLGVDTPILIVRIEESALNALLARLLGRTLPSKIIFEPAFDLTSEAAMRWSSAVQLMHTEVYYPGSLIQRGEGIGAIEELLMSSLLHLQPSNFRHHFSDASIHSEGRVVRKALNFIETHLGDALTVADIARSVHLSKRSIQQVFHDELGVSPMAYVQRRRLEHVRDELVDAMPSEGVTVAAVAHRWGFNHPGSFAVAYRRQWGESPSTTLRT